MILINCFHRNIVARCCQKKQTDQTFDENVNGAQVYENADAAMDPNYCVLERNAKESHNYELCTNVNKQTHNALPKDSTYYNVTNTE